MPHLALSMLSKMVWSTVSNAAERSMATKAMMDCLSKAHSMSLLILKTAVSQINLWRKYVFLSARCESLKATGSQNVSFHMWSRAMCGIKRCQNVIIRCIFAYMDTWPCQHPLIVLINSLIVHIVNCDVNEMSSNSKFVSH